MTPAVAGRSPAARVLSPRELEVLRLVSEGRGTQEIARALFVTEDTVKTHVARILRKLGARSRAHAVAIAFNAGFFGEDAR